MARIRTIKPAFWTDPKIDELSNDCALLFIGIWNFCDDHGFFSCHPRALSLCMPRFKAQAILGMVSHLARLGLVRVSREAGVGLVVGWSHQLIRDKRATKWNESEIKWDSFENDAPRSDENVPVWDRIVEDRKGSSYGGQRTKRVRTPKTLKDPIGPSPVTEIKAAFLESFQKEFNREYSGWGVKENSLAKKFLASVPLERAKYLCSIYPKWNDPYHVKRGHPFELLATQYVQLDAWAHSHDQLIKKIAQGKAAENVDLKRAVDFEEMKHGLKYANSQQANTNLTNIANISKQLSNEPKERIPDESFDPFSEQVFEHASETDHAEGF